MHCGSIQSIALRFKAQILLNFDRNHMKLPGTDENCSKIQGKTFLSNFCQKCGSYRRKTWRALLTKVKFCTKGNQTLLFNRFQNNFFVSRPLQGANISQIFSFTETTKPHEIQPVPNIWGISFHQPVRISIDSVATVASFQLVPKYISKVKVISKYFTLKQLLPWKMGAKGQIP